MAGNSAVDKTYKLLFIIYAPITLAGIFLKMYGDIQSSYLQVLTLSLCFASIVFAIGIIFSYLQHKKALWKTVENNIPYILRHGFLVSHMIATILSFTALAYYGSLGEGLVAHLSGSAQSERETLTILAQLPRESGAINDGDISTLNGLTQWVARHSDVHQSLRIDLLDHNDQFTPELEEELIQLINMGRQYIICIGSPACVPLSNKFEDIIAKTDSVNPPILITTYAYGQVNTQEGISYRFSPSSLNEVQALVKAALSKPDNLQASFITSDNEFGANAADMLMQAWRSPERSILPGIYVDSRADEQRVEDFVSGTGMLSNLPDVLFVSTGTDINNVLIDIAKLTDTDFLFSSVYPRALINELIDQGIAPSRIYRAELDYVSSAWPWKPQHNGEALLYLTLEKLKHVLTKTKGNALLFHDAWMEANVPLGVKFERSGNADFIFSFLVRSNGKVVSL
ncbi:MAG: hypothetical protein KAG18_09185, partial [Sinobacterium sp.]|nr:hypothetical protein [Sinobacterium sp.]